MRAPRALPLALLTLAAAAILVVPASAKKAPFSPKTLAGTWNGTWTNTTFGSTGPAFIKVRSLAKNTKLLATADFGGNVFGCQDPPSETAKALTKGKGPNKWNANGFVAQQQSKALGSVKLTYTHKTGALVGGGNNPTCNPELTWKVNGKFTGNTFSGTVDITLAGGVKAQSKVQLKRG